MKIKTRCPYCKSKLRFIYSDGSGKNQVLICSACAKKVIVGKELNNSRRALNVEVLKCI